MVCKLVTVAGGHRMGSGIALGTGILGIVAALQFVSPVFAETLDEALASAYQSNPVLLAARAELRAVDEQVPAALSNWRPTVQFTGTVGKVSTNQKSGFFSSNGNRTPGSAGARISQPVYRGGRTLAETKRADHLVLSERSQLKSTEQSVLVDTATAYMDVLRDLSVLDLSVKNETRLRRQLDAARDRFSVGEVTRTDVVQSEARVSNAVADRVRAQGDLDSSRDTFIRVVGMPPVNLEWPEPLGDLPHNKEDATNLALSNNPDVLASIFNGAAAEDDVDLVLGEFLPSVSLDGLLETASETNSVDSVSNGPNCSQPCRCPCTKPVWLARARARRKRCRHKGGARSTPPSASRSRRRRGPGKISKAIAPRSPHLAIQSAQTRSPWRGVEQEASVGLRTTLDVLDAEQELFEAEVDLVRARRNTTVAAFNLSATVGTFNAADLALPVTLYDDTEHYDEVRWKIWGGFLND